MQSEKVCALLLMYMLYGQSKTRTRERGGGQGTLQRDVSTNNSLEECLSHDRCTISTGMSVINREVAVHSSEAQRLVAIRDVCEMVDVWDSRLGGCGFGVSHEARLRVNKYTSLPRVVRSLRGDDHISSLRLELLRGRLDIGTKGKNGLGDSVVGSAARLASGAGTVGPSIVGGR